MKKSYIFGALAVLCLLGAWGTVGQADIMYMSIGRLMIQVSAFMAGFIAFSALTQAVK